MMPISFDPMRAYMKTHGFTYYYLGNQGIDAKTIDRIRHDRPITTTTLSKLCALMNCQPGDLICYLDE